MSITQSHIRELIVKQKLTPARSNILMASSNNPFLTSAAATISHALAGSMLMVSN